jgi:microsomal dipeptidase-like Zn-dependent dipeptidase
LTTIIPVNVARVTKRGAAHAAYVAERAGVETVALGSDFDGATMQRIAVGNSRRVLRATRAG